MPREASQLSSIKVNFVPCLSKVIIHLAAAGFLGGCLFSALRYSLVAWFFSVIALFQGITGIKALPVFHYSPDDMKHLSHTGNKCKLFAFAPVQKSFVELLYDRIYPCSYQCSHVKMVPYPGITPSAYFRFFEYRRPRSVFPWSYAYERDQPLNALEVVQPVGFALQRD